MKEPITDYLVARLAEPSTWSGLVLLLTSFGVTLSPEQAAAIVSTGLAVTGAIGTLLPDGNLKTVWDGVKALAQLVGGQREAKR